jgi:hypothetical protein
MSLCILCKALIVDPATHRECLLRGLEEGVVQSKADWLKKSKPKPRKVIRKVLLQLYDTNLPKSVYDPNQSKV